MIYLDYNATTPIDREVAMAMKPFLEGEFGNPSSVHAFGTRARKAIEQARAQVAGLIGCTPGEIIFTSGGTESNNMAIRGIGSSLRERGNHLITSAVEHPAVLEVCRFLEKQGFEISYLPVDDEGRVSEIDLKKAIRPSTILVTIMHANNEIGTIQDIPALSRIAREQDIIFHTDAAQSLGKIPVSVDEMGVDLLSIAGHKLYAPKGIGALYVRKGTRLDKLMYGANHEQNLRPGTENVLEIVGLGKACEIAGRDLAANRAHFSRMRDLLWDGIRESQTGAKRNGSLTHVLPNTLSVSFPGVEANTIVSRMEEVAVSAGAACHAENIDVSTVLEAISLPIRYAMGTVRFSTGKYTTESEISQAVRYIDEIVSSLGKSKKDTVAKEGVKLTQFTHGLGCACKLEPDKLAGILAQFPPPADPDILVGTGTSDDASVYRISDEVAIVQTLDFFTPVVDDPYDFGAIAAANAISDIYAMGGKPLYAQNIVGFPEHTLPLSVLEEILRGARDKASEAGIEVTGGHSIEDPEPKFGMVVTGTIHPQRIIRNFGARPGDQLILTKPLGSGIMTTALKRGLLEEADIRAVSEMMGTLNRLAAEQMGRFPVSCCTDITGFGLLGHLREMSVASGCDVQLHFSQIPFLKGVPELAASGIIPGGTRRNLSFVSEMVRFNKLASYEELMIADAQTSGGLLIALDKFLARDLLQDLRSAGLKDVHIIGEFTVKGPGLIHVGP